MIALNGCSSICFYCLRFGNAPLSAIHHRSKSLRDQVPATWIQLWLVWWLVNKSDVWCVTNDLMSLMYQRVESKSNYIASSTELSGYVFIVVNGILVGVIHKALGACHQAVQHLPLVGQWFVSSFFWCVSFWWMLPVCVCVLHFNCHISVESNMILDSYCKTKYSSAKVRNTVVQLFLQLQRVVMHAETLEKPEFIKACIEWDETSQAMRLRRGIVCVEGVLPTLVPFWNSATQNLALSFCTPCRV